uniref:BRO1 domain-containing protein n=1 Tax=Triticum aestivum TaxID=4565 RepID=A0A3B6PPG2_WHEAT
MGCGASKWRGPGVVRRGRPRSVGEVVVFLPGLRVPRTVDFSQSLGDHLDKSTVERLSSLRATVMTMAMQESAMALKPRRRATRHGGSGTANLLQALEDYLPVLLGLVKEKLAVCLRNKVQFVWANQEDDAEETSMADAWYEVLSVLHLMAMVCFLQANSLLLPRSYGEGHGPRVSEESRRATVDVFLKAGGYLDCAINQVLPQIPPEKRRALPVDLVEGNLKALSLQGLGQGVDMQLGLAIDNPKATLAVKRRLACEMVKYWQQIKDSIPELPLSDGWAKKHTLFVKWKYAEAKAAAYYFHGLILDEGNTEKSQEMATSSLQASEEFLKESKRASEVFHSTPPTSRISTPFGTTKHLLDMIPKETLSKLQNNQDLNTQERTSNTGVSRIITPPPPLPDFPLALNPEEYELPQLGPLLKKEANH